MALVVQLIQIYSYLIIGRIILSWFPISRGGPLETAYSLLFNVTEPVLGPVRRALPPLGGFDLSPIVVLLALELLASRL